MFDFHNTMIHPSFSKVNSRQNVDLCRTFSNNLNVCPIIASNMDTVGTLQTAGILSSYKIMTCLHKYHTPDEINNNKIPYCIPSIGIQDKDFDMLKQISGLNIVCIDTPNGYIDKFYKFCERVRKAYPELFIIAGNIICKKAIQRLGDLGINCAKVGIGQGEFCSTRIMTGIGKPQLEAVMECAESAKYYTNLYVMSDGGIKTPGDMCKAFVAGADIVMCGSIFAAHDENRIIPDFGRDSLTCSSCEVYGMASEHALEKHGLKKSYRSPEGNYKVVRSKGKLSNTVEYFLGGLRSCCTYIGVDKIEEMYQGVLYKCS